MEKVLSLQSRKKGEGLIELTVYHSKNFLVKFIFFTYIIIVLRISTKYSDISYSDREEL